jgi:hypothetical protein
MYVTQLFCQPESENIVHTANNTKPEAQCNKSLTLSPLANNNNANGI